MAAEASGICEAGYWKGGNCLEKELQKSPQGPWILRLNTELHICMAGLFSENN